MGSLAWRHPADLKSQPSPPVTIGVDVGQKVDPTAIVVAEQLTRGIETLPGKNEAFYVVRHMERLPLGTEYPAVANRIVQIVENVLARERPVNTEPPKITLVVDATGVGAPVIDIIRTPIMHMPHGGGVWRSGSVGGLGGRRVTLTEATFTHGDRLTGKIGGAKMSVGKAYLVSRLQALFQTARLQLPANHREAEALTRELMDYEIKVSEDANDRYGAFKVGTHDDLVTALGLAVLTEPRRLATAKSY